MTEERIISNGGSPAEQPTVRTTIVGGRPPGPGKGVGAVPRGIDVLVKKAAVDPEFEALLLAERSAAAAEIGLELNDAETAMLDGVPETQLEVIIANTTVSPKIRPAFMGRAAAVMLAALGVSITGCMDKKDEGSLKKRVPDKVYKISNKRYESIETDRKTLGGGFGIRPDTPTEPSPLRIKAFYDEVTIDILCKIKSVEGPGQGDGTRSTYEIDKTVLEYYNELAGIYRTFRPVNPEKLSGDLVVSFDITTKGTVSGVTVLEDNLDSTSIEEGVIASIETWSFLPAENEVTVVIELEFYNTYRIF